MEFVGASFRIHEILKTLSKLGITMKIRSTLGRCEKKKRKEEKFVIHLFNHYASMAI